MSDFSEVCCESSAEGTWKTDIGAMISTQNTGTIIPTSTINSYPTKMGFDNVINHNQECSSDVIVNGCNSDVCKENAKNLAVSADCGSAVAGEALTNGVNPAQSSCERKEESRCTCKCSSSEAVKRRVSTSDINFAACDIFTHPNTIPLKKNVLGSGRSLEKVDKINLANLVFNPNFKNSAGCVNLPVIRAGQNLAQKNAQRSALAFTKDPVKDLNNNLTEQDTIDLITQQLQPQSLDALASKIQQLSLQRKLKTGSSPNLTGSNDVEEDGGEDGDIIQTFNGKSAAPTQSNALRYKTELCRSYEEGGECRFGSACTFAHGPEELRPVPRHPLYKTELCRTYHQHGYCQYGTRCHFIHDADEADKNAPLKGCKTWGRHDQLSSALLSMAASCGLLEGDSAAGDNDVLLANLRRLYALRMMNTQEKQQEVNSQFSMSQPMSQQLSMAHQQLASASHQHLPLSMTQPLPMDAMQMSLQRAAGQVPQRASMVGHNRLESLANEYSSWGMVPPPSPTYSGISPFASYQQFSPLPHHQMAHHSYPHYAFSATAPDLSTALSMSPYGVSPQTFSNTVNVGQLLQDQNGNYQAASAAVLTQNGQQMQQQQQQQPKSLAGGGPASVSAMNPQQSHLTAMPNPMWPATSNEVSSAIDKELFGFGLDSQQAQHGGVYQQYQYPFFQQQQQQQQQQQSQPQPQQQQQQVPKQAYYTGSVESSMKLNSHSSSSSHRSRSSEVDLLSLINNDKYARRESGTLKTISEAEDVKHSQGVRPKTSKIKSCNNAGVIVDS